MGITGPDKTELIGIGDPPLFQCQPVAKRFTRIGTFNLAQRVGSNAIRHNFEARQLITARQLRMGFRGPLDLGDLDDRLIAYTLNCVVVIQRVAGPVDKLEHLAVRCVGVVRYRKALHPFGAQIIHPLPEVLRIGGVKPRERHPWQAVTTGENHVAVQVAHISRGRCVLVGNKRCERAGIIVIIRSLDGIAPSTADNTEGLFPVQGSFPDH